MKLSVSALNRRNCRAGVFVVGAFIFGLGHLFGPQASASNGTWANSTGDGNATWSSSGNWLSGSIPGTTTIANANTDVANFQAAAIVENPILDASRKLGVINIDNSQANYSIGTTSSSNILYLSTTGTTTPQFQITGSGTTTINPMVALAAVNSAWKTGSTALTLAGGLSVAVSSGTWSLNNTAPITVQGTVSDSVAGSTSLFFDGSGSVIISGTIQNGTSSAFNYSSNATFTGTVAITGTSTSSQGTVTWRSGTWEVGSSGALGNVTALALGTTTAGGGPLNMLTLGAYTVGASISFNSSTVNQIYTVGGIQTSGTSFYTGAINLGNSSTTVHPGGLYLTSATGGTVVFSNVISGTGSVANTAITKTGGGVVALTGVNSYVGVTNIQNGTLSINTVATGTGSQSLGANASLNVGVSGTSSGTLLYTGTTGTLGKVINILGNGNDTIQNGGSGVLTLSGSLIHNGTTVTLNSSNSGINVTGVISGSNAGSNLLVTGSAPTVLNKANTYNGITTIYGGGVLVSGTNDALSDTNTAGVTATTSLTLGNGISETSGTDTYDLAGFNQVLSGLNTNNSGTVFNQVISSNGAGGASTTTGTLTVNNANENKFAGSLGSGSAANFAFIKTGTGTFYLGGASSYTGATTVNAGTLVISGFGGAITNTSGVTINTNASMQVDGTLGGGAVNVKGTLSGTGAVMSAVTVSAGGQTNPNGVLTLDLAYSGSSKANFNVSGTNPGGGRPQGHLSGLYYSQIAVSGSANVVNLGIGTGVTIGANNATSLSETAAQIQGDGSSNSGVTLQLSLTSADYTTLLANKTNAYQGFGPNSSLDNYFVFTLGSGLSTGRFQTLDLNIDGTDYTGTIYYTGVNDRFAGAGVGNTIGDVIVNGQEFAVSYTGDVSTNSTTGGHDIVVTAIPEPGTWGMILGGFGMLIGIQKLRRCKAYC